MSSKLNAHASGMELVEITPVIVGGDAADPKNKAWLTRQQHFEFVRYWNKIVAELRTKDCRRLPEDLA